MPVQHLSVRLLAGTFFAGLATTTLLAQVAGTSDPLARPGIIQQAQRSLDDGELVMAQRLLREAVKSADLSVEARGLAAELLERTDKRIKSADVVEISLQKASLDMTTGELVQAERQLLAVLSRGQIPATQREQASAMLRKLNAARAELAPLVADTIARAESDFKDGRFAQAKAALSGITRSGVELTPAQRSTVVAHQMRLVELETTRGSRFEESPVTFGLMQPGTVRRESEPVAQEQPAASPPPPVEQAQPQPAPAPSSDDLISMAMRADAERLIVEGDAAYTEGRFAEALRKYEVALSSGRNLLAAEQVKHAEDRVADCRLKLRAAGGADLLSSVRVQTDAIREKTKAEYTNELQQAKKALDAGDTARARELAARARVTVGSARQYFSQAENDGFGREIDEMNRQIASAEETIRQNDLATREAAVKEAALRAEQNLREDKDRRVREAIIRARALQQEQKYRDALQVVDQVLFLDPTNPTGLLLRDIIGDIIIYKEQDALYETRYRNMQRIQLENEGAAIPPTRIINYPNDWPTKTFQRGEAAAYNDSPDNRRAISALERRIPANFEGNRLADVMDFVRETCGVNVDVDWDSLRAIGIDRDMPIHLRLTDASASVVLERALAKASRIEMGERAGFSVIDGIVSVGSESSLRRTTVTQPYNITDLLLDVPNFTEAPNMDLRSVIASASGESGPASPFQSKPKSDLTPNRDDRIRQITSVITGTIDPDGWRDRGGDTSALQELNGSLIITTTPTNHREIAGLLGKLREQRSMQINVETRFLTVNQDFFEQIGFDLDVYFNTNSNIVQNAQLNDPTVLPSDFFDFSRSFVVDSTGNPQGPIRRNIVGQPTPLGVSPPGNTNDTQIRQGALAANRWSPIGVGSNTLGVAESLASGFSPFAADILSRAPALGIAGQFLDDIQVDFLIKATQADRRSSTLTAPRLTLTNGQVSNVYVATQRSFISDLTPVTGESAVGFDPQPGVLTEGVVMQVEGVISSDRRYVTLNIDTSVSQAERPFRQVGVTAVAGGQLVGSQATNSFIELPSINTTRVQTTVTVPDEGTVLLGGQRLVTELEVESGVPVLSKIPIINRFFTNRLSSKQEQTLMILIKPTVLIQTEEEERNFPGLSDSVKSGMGG
ncbi:MAG: hypothetical protein AB7K52_04130 [Phycisphaerales bacterium]